jgi:hypothetical protein
MRISAPSFLHPSKLIWVGAYELREKNNFGPVTIDFDVQCIFDENRTNRKYPRVLLWNS